MVAENRSLWTKDCILNYTIGEYTYGIPTVYNFKSKDYSLLSIGKFCSIANTTQILLAGEHFTENISTYPFKRFFPPKGKKGKIHSRSKGAVVIENDVWIGHNVIILSGVTIENGVCIGAGSVVTKSIPAYSIVAGNPVKMLKMRFNPEQIKKLLEIKWWEWDIEKIKRNIHIIQSSNIIKLEKVK